MYSQVLRMESSPLRIAFGSHEQIFKLILICVFLTQKLKNQSK